MHKIAARRSRSIAITTENKVYEWGFVGDDGMQFRKLFNLPEECLQVEIGLEFNLFLLKDGQVYFSGVITQEGASVLESDELICVSKKSNVTFKSIECGYSHALLINEEDKVYSFGANLYG